MAFSTPAVAVPIQSDDDGTIRVGGTRVTLETVIASYQQGETPERIQEGFPTLKLADIYAVITYYLHHQGEVDAYMRQQEAEGERIRQALAAKHPDMFRVPEQLRERLTQRDE